MNRYAVNFSIFLILLYSNCCSQTLSNIYFISKKKIQSNGVFEIKDLANYKLDSTYSIFMFNRGILSKEVFVSNELYGSKENSIRNGFIYTYEKTSDKNLIMKEGRGEAGPSNQNYFSNYKYLSKKLQLSIDGYSYSYPNETGDIAGSSNLTNIVKYYYLDQKLAYKVDYEIDIKEKSLSDLKLNTIMKSTESTKLSNLLTSINAEERKRTYFIYRDENLIGFYPAKNAGAMSDNMADSIYYQKKIEELRKIGFKSFRNKYFTKEVYKKILDDCYIPIKNNQLFVNGSPIKQFLSKMGKPDVKYIVFEIADNYFLFYKIID